MEWNINELCMRIVLIEVVLKLLTISLTLILLLPLLFSFITTTIVQQRMMGRGQQGKGINIY